MMHSPYLKQRKAGRWGLPCVSREAESLLCSVFSQSTPQLTLTSVSTCIHRRMEGIHIPAAYSNVAAANTTAVPCTLGTHTPTILHGCLPYASSFKLTLKLDA